MIYLSRLSSGAILLQREDTEICIDHAAIPTTLGVIIGELINAGRAVAAARRSGYEDGLVQGRINAAIEHETSLRIAARQAEELVEALAIGGALASAA